VYKGDQFVNIIKNHESSQPNMNSIVKLTAKITEDLNQLNEKDDTKRDEIQHMKATLGEVLKKTWKNKAMYEQYTWNIDRQLISEEDTFLWLMKGGLNAETESEIVAAQD
jgi:septation ring formation regulator EzrA